MVSSCWRPITCWLHGVQVSATFSAPRLRFELQLAGQPILSVKISKSSLLKCSRFRENCRIWRWMGLINAKLVHKQVLKIGKSRGAFEAASRSDSRVKRLFSPR